MIKAHQSRGAILAIAAAALFVFCSAESLLLSGGVQERMETGCPFVVIRLPEGRISDQGRITVSASIKDAKKVIPNLSMKDIAYTWRIPEGKIVSGQGTFKIVFEPNKGSTNDSTIPINLEVIHLPPECANRESVVLKVDPKCKPSLRFDEFRVLSDSDEMSHLNRIAKAFNKGDSNSAIFIVGYHGSKYCYDEAKLKANQARSYLMREFGFKDESIFVLDGGARQNATVDLFLGSKDSCWPIPEPTMSEEDSEETGPCSDAELYKFRKEY